MRFFGIFLFSISTLVLSIDGSSHHEGLSALALAAGWNVSATLFCEDKPYERRAACEQKFLKRKTPRPVPDEDPELAKALPYLPSGTIDFLAIGEQWMVDCRKKGTLVNNVCVIPANCPTQAIALEKLIRARSSIFNDYIENGIKFESLDLPRKEEEAVGFIAIQFIKNLQHDCNNIKPDVVKKCLEDGMPKPVEYEHKGVARLISEFSPDIRELFKKTLDEWETCTECDSIGCIVRPNCAVYAIAFEILLGERDPKYEKMIDDREGL